MSGGGQPMRGRMGSKIIEEFSAETIRGMQETVRVDEGQLRVIKERRQEVEPKTHALKSQLDKMRNELAKWKNELSSARDQIKEVKKFEMVCLKRMKEQVLDEAGHKRLEEALAKFKQQFEKADSLAAKLRDENEELHKKIVDISKRILDEPKAALKAV
jgi:chromosome segregation ATPase